MSENREFDNSNISNHMIERNQQPAVPPQPNIPAPEQLARISGMKKIQQLIIYIISGGIILAGCVWIILMYSSPISYTYDQYSQKYGKRYDSLSQVKYRQYTYYKKLEEIARHNYESKSTYTKGVNQFSDQSDAEFKSMYTFVKELGIKKKYIIVETNQQEEFKPDNYVLPEGQTFLTEISWVDKLPAVKDQHQCSSCYAFPVIGTIEGVYAIKLGQVISLSEQQVIDCMVEVEGTGCNDGSIQKGFTYVIKHGVTLEKNYRYTSKYGKSKKCEPPSVDKFTISKLTQITKGSCKAVEKALQTQPLSIMADVNNWSSYQSGIFDQCGRQYNHGVLLVGKTPEYWLVRNSWGKTWGQYGYIRLARGNTCGICDYASFPTI